MPVDATHEEYSATQGQWRRIRDVLAGDDAVKSAGIAYLPKPSGMDQGDYDAYRGRAVFYNATSRTLNGLVGAIFRKPPNLKWPDGLDDAMDNITLTGMDFDSFARDMVGEIISMARIGVIVEWSDEEGRPFLRSYRAEDITNWREDLRGGVPYLTLVVLREWRDEPKPDDPFMVEKVELRRVLSIDENGRYFQQVWERRPDTRGTDQFVPLEKVYPTKRGASLDYIPFQFVGPTNLSPCVEKSPILDLVDVNLSHWRKTCEIDHGAFYTALPTAWVAGGIAATKHDAELRIGSGTAWLLETGAQVGMLEYTGQGLQALENRLQRLEAHMAVLGARLLEDQKSVVEAAETIRLRHSGENSLLASIAIMISRGLKNCLNWYLDWLGRDQSAEVELNTDFFDASMTMDEVVKLVQAWQQGAIGEKVVYHNLSEGERLPQDMTFEEWQEDRNEGGPGAAFMDRQAAGGRETMPGDQTVSLDVTGRAA